MKEMIVLIGIPNSGKSSLAKLLVKGVEKSVICSADDFFMVDGEYIYNSEFIKDAHTCCREKAMGACKAEVEMVVIDNTNVSASEIEPYKKMAEKNGYTVREIIVLPTHDGDNGHKVPVKKVLSMIDRLRNRFNDLMLI
ncbi:MAG: AAA family ATPase [Methylococcales bacterium]|nr:hypothetical protein [Methylococcaceae bacterium]